MQRLSAKHLLATAVLAFALLEGAAVGAAELPTYEVSSFPATPHQLSVLGSDGRPGAGGHADADAQRHARLAASA